MIEGVVYASGGRGELVDFGGEWTTSDRIKLGGIGRRADSTVSLR